VTAATADKRTLHPSPIWPPSAPPPSFPLADRRPVVLADDPCEAGFPASDPEYAGIYLHARYFDPKLGTFLSPDPIGVEGGLNQYGYGFGDPLNNSDPSGLDPNTVFCYPYPYCTGQGGGRGGSGGFVFGTPGGGGGVPNPVRIIGCALFGPTFRTS